MTRLQIPSILAIALLMNFACSKQAAQTSPKEQTSTAASEVSLTPAALAAAGIEIEAAGQRSAAERLQFTGTIEPNQQQIQQVTPLVSGRVDRVLVSLGTAVKRGSVLAVISSPGVAEMHGKLLESEAKLNQAEATLRRTRKLSEIGAAAGKDLIAAEADAQTAKLDVAHLRDALRAVGDPADEGKHNIAEVSLRSPIDGVITERNVNPGSGAEANRPLFTVANLSSVWVIANVPEAHVPLLSVGANAEVQAAALGSRTLSGRISYMDPILNEATRTARVRVDVRNRQNRLRVGMFATVTIETNSVRNASIVVPEDAVQRVGEKDIVFVQKANGVFEAREIVLGELAAGQRQVVSGLAAGERIATRGSFTLKAQLLKSQFAEAD